MPENDDLPKWAESKFGLTFPVGDLKELAFVEPNGEALEAIEGVGLEEGKNPTIKQTIAIISILSTQPIDVIRKMNQRDIKGAAEAMVPLLEGAI
ncbi:hypothetical protein [Rhizobium leguminosarum]|uniref:hypothetical protein n=1 Tax=Rhizobium leguminosarum TaxID=384 RepID=UPI001031F8CD|nr:hypothetical protein [Rhizobium leguminosarum]TBG03774.1 hypothetical protein ELG82_09580 [Rhizobium leguminosarum]